MANTLKRMERDGLVRRAAHPSDNRAQLICLTAKGRGLEADAKEAAQRVNQLAFSDLTRADRAAFLALAGQMIARLQRG
jgi:DNA-binding MarR family transcriptional regulator